MQSHLGAVYVILRAKFTQEHTVLTVDVNLASGHLHIHFQPFDLFSRMTLPFLRYTRNIRVMSTQTRRIQTQARFDYSPQDDSDDARTSFNPIPAGLATPRQVVHRIFYKNGHS